MPSTLPGGCKLSFEIPCYGMKKCEAGQASLNMVQIQT